MRSFTPRVPGMLRQRRRASGFTLIELVVVITILGVLAAIAVPMYIALGRDARVAAVNTLLSSVRSTSQNVHVLCKLDPTCDYGAVFQVVTVAGRSASVIYGWLDSGNNGGSQASLQIGAWINFSGFTAGYAWPITSFALDGAPDPANCSVSYTNAFISGPAGPLITAATSGC